VTQTLDPAGDQREIRQLVERYAAAVDSGDGDSAAELFAPDGVFEIWLDPASSEPTSTRHGPGEIAPAINGLRGNYLTQHVIANSVVDIDPEGERGSGHTQCTAHHVKLDDPDRRDEVMHLVYDEQVARIEGRWRFTRRVLRVRWTEIHAVESM
jgi:uncharacterized protein (TIGR02246 family)